MNDKARFYACIYSKILRSWEWGVFHQSIFGSVNKTLLSVIALATKHPHNPDCLTETKIHFKVRSFLSKVAFSTWECTIKKSGTSDPMRSKFPTQLLLPTMRKLGMMDVLDYDYGFYGPWEEILEYFNLNADTFVAPTRCDRVLATRSDIWKRARNSIDCHAIAKGEMFGGLPRGPPAPQCFRYFSKCSVKDCCNIETAEEQHKLRCTICYYHHFCSDACYDYAQMFGEHDCNFNPPEKAKSIMEETSAYLGWDKDEKVNEEAKQHAACNFCGATRASAPGQVLALCKRCQSVAYVSVSEHMFRVSSLSLPCSV